MVARNLSAFAAILLVSAVATAQSGFAGKWTGEEPAAGGTLPVALQLSVNGSAVTGAITVGDTPTQAISEAKVDGTSLTFKTSIMMNGKEVPMLWEGDLKDSQLTLTRSVGASGRKLPPFVMQRSK